MTNDYCKAVALLAQRNTGHRKIRTSIASIQHYLNVASMLIHLGYLESSVVIAGLLHDSVEDFILSEDEVRDFGYDVHSLVMEMSDSHHLLHDRKKTWQERKNQKLSKIKFTPSFFTLLIIACDLTDNLNSLIEDYRFTNGKVFKMLNGNKEQQSFYYTQAANILIQRSSEFNSKNLRLLSIDLYSKAYSFFY